MAQPEIVCLTNGAFAENCYIVADPETGEATIVDPGEEAELFLRRVDSADWTVKAVWLTHAHLDHILGVEQVVRATGAPIYLHPDDRDLYDRLGEQGKWLGLSPPPAPPPDFDMVPGEKVHLGGLSFEVRHVPGHSPGSVALVGHGVALVGDALFAGSVGRVDLPGGDGETLLRSIRQELLSLPDDTTVYSGHGPPTTIGHERATNPFLTGVYPLA